MRTAAVCVLIVGFVCGVFACGAVVLGSRAAGAAERPLVLEKSGAERKLPERILGASAEPLIEYLINDTRKVAALKEMDLAFVRFPGGSQSNYYNWRTGLLEMQVTPQSSAYTRFWAGVLPKIAAAHPQGILIQDYTKFARQIGAEIVFVPNLETSSVAEQVEWFRKMKADGAVPRYIELGNEFWIAMMFDPDVLKRWPDAPTTMKVMKEYAEALRPFLPPGARVAVQAAGSEYWVRPNPVHPMGRRLRQWDADLAPAPWFDAVTIHPYPGMDNIMGTQGATKGWRQPEEAPKMFKALLAHCDQGIDRVVEDVARHVPGKEIWVTEWNTRGADYHETAEPTAAMRVQLESRTALAMLRHPEVTMSLWFTMNFSSNNLTGAFLPDGQEGFQPKPPVLALRWFNEAANGGATFQRFVEAGGQRVPGGGALSESYLEVEAALFRLPGRTTLIIQNCSPEARAFTLPASIHPGAPASVETLAAPELTASGPFAPAAQPAGAGAELKLPPYSLTRVIWKQPA